MSRTERKHRDTSMSDYAQANQDQAKNWNGASGQVWVQMQPLVDTMFAPLESILVDAGYPRPGGRVLDIGCGAGATSFAMARRLGPEGACLGVDISAPLVGLARNRTRELGISNAKFEVADVQTHRFEAKSFDAAISRFGVMFFGDPVAAFANVRSALRENGKLAFLAWRSPQDNPFMTAAARAARPYLPELSHFVPNAPGQFGFADKDYVTGIMGNSGWSSVTVEPVDVKCELPAADLDSYIANMGPVAAALRERDPAEREKITAIVRQAFNPFVQGEAARFDIACWLATAFA
jgi:SAM-dependent methyltransferase